MNIFEILILILVAIFVFSSLYFAITGRNRAIKAEAKDDERFAAQNSLDEQIKVLTVRLGEITTENDRLNKVCRSWMEIANSYKLQLDTKNKEVEDWMKQSEEYKENAKKAESKCFEIQQELNKLQIKAGN